MDNTLQMDIIEGKKPSVFKRVLILLLVTAVLLGGAAYIAGFILFKGPSAYAGHQFVRAVQEDSVLSMLPKLYLTDTEIAYVLSEESTNRQFSVFPGQG